MLSFMLISAVAFSAYMRYARLPSSYLRRSSASRMLVKAALAEAIDEIDAAIGNNPHPGVGKRNPRRGAGSLNVGVGESLNENLNTRNHWRSRVYIGTNELYETDRTVSTLSLEGLAYIPPALVNEARYYSRRSQAGVWKNLGFDAGRYAFCAIDVSDHFDVNVLAAKIGRSSSAAGKISLAYLFEDDEHKNYEGDPKTWDDAFMVKGAQVREISTAEAELAGQAKPAASAQYVPFVSVADLNLAIHNSKPNGWESPFCQYIEQNGADFLAPYGVTDATGKMADRVKRMCFVTDGWFPEKRVYSTSEGGEINPKLDLLDDNSQPFLSGDMASCDTMDFRTILRSGDVYDENKKSAFRLKSYIGGLGLAMLYDYLDENNVPLSLAIPSAERAPAIVGIQQNVPNVSVQITSKTEPEGADVDPTAMDNPGVVKGGGPGDKTRTVEYTKTYSLDGTALATALNALMLKAVVAFPFPHKQLTDSFKLDGHVSVFFSSEPMTLRAENSEGTLHIRSDISPDLPRMISGLKPEEQNVNGVFHISLGEHTLNFPDEIKDETSAVLEVSNFNTQKKSCCQQIEAALAKYPLLKVTWQHDQEAEVDPETGKAKSWHDIKPRERTAASSELPVLKADGSVDAELKNKATLLSYLQGGGSKTLNMNLAVTFRIKNAAAKTVDLVPACMADDNEHNAIDNMNAMGNQARRLGDLYPLMPFAGTATTPLVFHDENGFDKMQGGVQLSFAPKGVMCLDPRWNWAPEHWFVDDNVSSSDWLQKCDDLFKKRGAYASDNWYRDRDIFLASSDAGYLQSVYELAFLPVTCPMEFSNTGGSMWGSLDMLSGTTRSAAWAQEQDFVAQDDTQRIPNSHLMWRTYWPFDRRDAKSGKIVYADVFDEIRLVSNGNGYKVNPYSIETNIVLAAFANTPYSWWAAALNPNKDTGVSESERKNVQQFNKTYCFNDLGGAKREKIVWGDLKRIASTFIRSMHDESHANDENWTWEDSFDWLSWSGNQNMQVDNPSEDPEEYKNYFCIPSGTTESINDLVELDSQTCDLYDIDRKFLYGFWHECFAAKQQLFLVFVRAEPMMMGGGTLGKTPPQLGGKAVALVWRDPTTSKDDNTPHKTRVLFYRQFD